MDSTIRVERDANNLATVWVDVPAKAVNTLTPQVLAELDAAITELSANAPVGVIIASGKPGHFVAGADLFEIRKMDRDQLGKYLGDGQRLFHRISQLPFPTAVAINGDCLGGGYELALACTYRVAADGGSINIGLPETKLGILPAWGGTTRLPRTIGLARVLPLILAGKTVPPRKAAKLGMVDEVVRPEALLAACRRLLTSHKDQQAADWTNRFAAATPFLRNRILAAAEAQTKQKTDGNYPAPLKVIEVMRAGYENGFDAGLKAEQDAILELMDTPACRNLMRLFFLRQGAKRSLAQHVQAKPREVKYAAVFGGGTMGAAIVHALVRSGIETRLIEIDARLLGAGLARVRALLDEDVGAGRLNALQARDAMHRVAPSIEWTGLELADVVIEAVLEKLEAKRELFSKLDSFIRLDCVLATNTSSLLVGDMAEATRHPQRVVGIHFFNPVAKMPLVEIVRGPHSDDQSLATAIGLATRLGKTPVLVNDAPGFLVNRVLIPYLAEALATAAEGTPIAVIDSAMRRWGMPMGPFELLDEIGLDVSHHVLGTLAGSLGDRLPAMPAAVGQAIEKGWLGKKTRRGYYVYGDKGKQPDIHTEMVELLQPTATSSLASPDAEREKEIQWRLILPMINEAARLLAEGVTDSTEVIDLATVLGTGLAPFRGGLAHFAGNEGLDVIITRMNDMALKHGPRFAPPELLRELVASHHPLNEFAVAGAVTHRPKTAPWRTNETHQEH